MRTKAQPPGLTGWWHISGTVSPQQVDTIREVLQLELGRPPQPGDTLVVAGVTLTFHPTDEYLREREAEAGRAALEELRAEVEAAFGFETNTVNRGDLLRAIDRRLDPR